MRQKLTLDEVVVYYENGEERKGFVRVVDSKTYKIVNAYCDIFNEKSNIDKLFELCSDLSDIIPYPYFFNWSPPTNWRHKENDISYAIIRVGKYIPTEYVENDVEYFGRNTPIEKPLYFGPVHSIFQFRFFENVSTLDEIRQHKDEIIKYLDTLFEGEKDGIFINKRHS